MDHSSDTDFGTAGDTEDDLDSDAPQPMDIDSRGVETLQSDRKKKDIVTSGGLQVVVPVPQGTRRKRTARTQPTPGNGAANEGMTATKRVSQLQGNSNISRKPQRKKALGSNEVSQKKSNTSLDITTDTIGTPQTVSQQKSAAAQRVVVAKSIPFNHSFADTTPSTNLASVNETALENMPVHAALPPSSVNEPSLQNMPIHFVLPSSFVNGPALQNMPIYSVLPSGSVGMGEEVVLGPAMNYAQFQVYRARQERLASGKPPGPNTAMLESEEHYIFTIENTSFFSL